MENVRFPNYWLADSLSQVGIIFGKYSYQKFKPIDSEVTLLKEIQEYIDSAIKGNNYTINDADLNFNYRTLVEIETATEVQEGLPAIDINEFLDNIAQYISKIINYQDVSSGELKKYQETLFTFADNILESDPYYTIDEF